MSVKSILSEVGTVLKEVFKVGTEAATIAEPVVDLALPGVASLYNATVSEVVSAETAAIAAGAQSGSGAQKLAAVIAAVTPTFNAYAAANGLATPAATTIEAYVNAVVSGLNAIPAPVNTVAPVATGTSVS